MPPFAAWGSQKKVNAGMELVMARELGAVVVTVGATQGSPSMGSAALPTGGRGRGE